MRNAADPRQVKHAARVEQRQQQREDDALKATLETPLGRSCIWTLIRKAGVFKTPFDMHGGRQSYNIGRGDFGRELLAECLRVAPDLYLLMEQEARQLDARDAASVDAVTTRGAETGE